MSLQFDCPNCNLTIPVDPTHAGEPVDCPNCSWTVMIPKVDVLMENRDMIKFLCPSCGRKLSATRPQFGSEMPCPYTDCEKPILIPRPEWKPVPTTIIQKGAGENPNTLVAEAEELTRSKAGEDGD